MKRTSRTTPTQKPIDFRYNGTIYILEPIKPRRLIWHVTRKSNRESISSRGLIPCRKLVFANNQDQWIHKMWCVLFAQYDSCFYYPSNVTYLEHIESAFICESFDFWRIDTSVAKCHWYIDPFLVDEYAGWGGLSARHYICTPQRILPEALRLYEFDATMENKLFIKKYEGWVSVGLNTLPLRRVA